MTKIYIMGSGGSGKTTLSKLLSQKENSPYLELDDIYWDNSVTAYNVKKDKEERNAILNNFLSQNKSWIIDGVYYKDWVKPIFKEVDIVYILKPNFLLSQFRCIKRDIYKWYHKERVGGIVSLYHLLKWNIKYRYKILRVVENILKKQKIPYKILKTNDINERLKELGF
ncbi:MAG: DNA topology modulation protein FlaR [Alphaproteobacteria bacterium]|nr:DNA topology modulation protein FlaR [Alphaproteobacteria bacterium]